MIGRLPKGQGVYKLYHHGSLVYVGKADSRKMRLDEHRRKISGRGRGAVGTGAVGASAVERGRDKRGRDRRDVFFAGVFRVRLRNPEIPEDRPAAVHRHFSGKSPLSFPSLNPAEFQTRTPSRATSERGGIDP